MEPIQETAYITERGTLTLPASIRRALGVKGKQQVLIETNASGEIRVRLAAVVPIEIYTEERIAEFSEQDEALGKLLDRLLPKA